MPRPFTDESGRRWVPLGQQDNPKRPIWSVPHFEPGHEPIRHITVPPAIPQRIKGLPVGRMLEHDVPLPSVEEEVQATSKSRPRPELDSLERTQATIRAFSPRATQRSYVTAQAVLPPNIRPMNESEARKRGRISPEISRTHHIGPQSNVTKTDETSNYIDLTSPKRPRIQQIDNHHEQGSSETVAMVPSRRLVYHEPQSSHVQFTTSHQKRSSGGTDHVDRYFTNLSDDFRSAKQRYFLNQAPPDPSGPQVSKEFVPVRSPPPFPSSKLILPEWTSQRDMPGHISSKNTEHVMSHDLDHWQHEDRLTICRTNSDQAIQERYVRTAAVGIPETGSSHVQFRDVVRSDYGRSSQTVQLRSHDPLLGVDATDDQGSSHSAWTRGSTTLSHTERVPPRLQNLQTAERREVAWQPSAAGYQQQPFSSQVDPREALQSRKAYYLQPAPSNAGT